MASHFSAIKRARQTERRTERNRAHSSRLRTVIRGFREILAGEDKKTAEAQYRETVAAIDKAAKHGALHPNTAARYKSRLAARLNDLK
jgi:small subunit ribosomal protein S20